MSKLTGDKSKKIQQGVKQEHSDALSTSKINFEKFKLLFEKSTEKRRPTETDGENRYGNNP